MKKYIVKPCIVGVCLILMAGSVLAAVKPGNPLYETQVQANEVLPQDQQKLIQQAFKDVLVKLTGSEKILKQASTLKAITDVDKYVSQFGYQLSPTQERLLRVRFDEMLTNELIQSIGQPVLSHKRPSVVVWLAMQQGNVTQWVGDAQNELISKWQALANQRGLPLVFPLLDLTDTALVSEQSVWTEDLPSLQNASKRYNTDQVLIGKLSKQPSGWHTQWILIRQGVPLRWETSYSSTEDLLGESLEALLTQLVDSESLPEPSPQESKVEEFKMVRLSVSGVSGVEDYAKVLDYLRGLPKVNAVDVTEVNPLETIFNVKTTLTQEEMIQSIGLNRWLVQSSPPSPELLRYKIAIEDTE